MNREKVQWFNVQSSPLEGTEGYRKNGNNPEPGTLNLEMNTLSLITLDKTGLNNMRGD